MLVSRPTTPKLPKPKVELTKPLTKPLPKLQAAWPYDRLPTYDTEAIGIFL